MPHENFLTAYKKDSTDEITTQDLIRLVKNLPINASQKDITDTIAKIVSNDQLPQCINLYKCNSDPHTDTLLLLYKNLTDFLNAKINNPKNLETVWQKMHNCEYFN